MSLTDPSRRSFLVHSSWAAGALVLSVPLVSLEASAADDHRKHLQSAYIRIYPTGPVVLIMPKVEMGQGIYTGLALLIAEELELRLDQLVVEAAPPLPQVYGVAGDQSTGGSTSTKDCWVRLRHAGAQVREWLLAAAAAHWRSDVKDCYALEGQIIHRSSLRSMTYGECAQYTHAIPMPQKIKLKKPGQFKLVGRSHPRLDTPVKVDGSATFGIDVRLPSQVYAALAITPTLGGTVRTLNETAALGVPGVLQVVNLKDVVAVIARNTYAARQGLAALSLEWTPGPYGHLNQSDIEAACHHAIDTQKGAIARLDKTPTHLLKGTLNHKARFVQPFLAHATMEPMNALVHVQGSRVTIWTGTQAPDRLVDYISKLGFKPENIHLHNHLIGGGFGRRLDVDGVEVAVRIAKHVNQPVQVIYSREQDIQHDRYRPLYVDEIEATVDTTGKPIHWVHHIAGGSATRAWDGKPLPKGVDSDAVEGAFNSPYDFDHQEVRYHEVNPKAIPVSWWRGVGPTRSILVVESFVDELSHLIKVDPIEYRLRYLKDPRAIAVLKEVAELANWGSALAPNEGRGVSVHGEFGSYLAQVVHVRIIDGELKLVSVSSVMDCGLQVNPDQIRAQIEGGSIFGLTAALYGKVTLKDGAIEQSNFHDYPLLRLSESPSFQTVLLNSSETPGGVGETATACIQAALLNAYFKATQKRVRQLPILGANI